MRRSPENGDSRERTEAPHRPYALKTAIPDAGGGQLDQEGLTASAALPTEGHGSVGVGRVAVAGVELVLQPVEGGLVDSGGRFDDGPGDITAHESLNSLHLAA